MSGKTKLNTKAVHFVFCIFFAFLLWLYVSYSVYPEVTKPITNITVTVIGEDKLNERNLSAKLISDDKVDVKVTAKRTLFNDINLKNARATVDVSSVTETGTVTLKASVAFLSVPSSSVVINTDKAEVTFLVETYDEKTLTVSPDIAKEPTGGYYINDFAPRNENDMTVTVSGIAEDVAKVAEVKTEKIDLSDASDDITKLLTLIPVDENGKKVESVKLSAQSISLKFEIYKEAAITLIVDPDEEVENVKYTIEPASVLLHGPASVIDAIPSIPVRFKSSGYFTVPYNTELVDGETNSYKIIVDKTE